MILWLSPDPVTAPAGASSAEPGIQAAKELPYEFQWQQNGYYCGPAAVRMALTSRGFYPSQDHLAGQLGTDEGGTDSAADTTRVLNSEGQSGYYETKWIPGQSATPAEIDLLRHDVVYDIDRGYPIVANIVGDAVDTDGDWHSYSGGHYLVITGLQRGRQPGQGGRLRGRQRCRLVLDGDHPDGPLDRGPRVFGLTRPLRWSYEHGSPAS